jgi:hypothetical protein
MRTNETAASAAAGAWRQSPDTLAPTAPPVNANATANPPPAMFFPLSTDSIPGAISTYPQKVPPS